MSKARRSIPVCLTRGHDVRKEERDIGMTAEPFTPYCAPGIYAVICTASGNAYVGSSKNCDRRLADHRSALRSQIHISKKLLDEWNRYGELTFEFKFVERVSDLTMLRTREAEWIKKIGTLNTQGRSS